MRAIYNKIAGRPGMKPGARGVFVAVAATALVTVALAGGVSGAAARDSGPEATAAKAKCGKKCRKDRATKFFSNRSFTFDTGFDPGSGHRFFERYDYCRNGTFFFQGDYTGFQGRSTATFNGTWKVRSSTIIAKKNIVKMPFTTSDFQTTIIEGEPRPKGGPGESGVESLVVTRAGFKFSFEEDDDILYRRGPSTC